jgi:2,4-diaminopentanoate dehydrogenase
MTTRQNYRVIQWATGNVGSRALRSVIEHPHLDLVGLWVSSEAKVGRDAGELAGLGTETGVKATNSVDDLVATEADCVLYMPQYTDLDDLCRLLESGKNVVSTRGEFFHAPLLPADVRDRIEAACEKGGVSAYSTGSSPGFITEAMVIPLLSLARRHECLTIDEYADVSSRDSPEMLFKLMGFGQKMAPFDQRRAEHLKADFGTSLSQIAEAIGLPVDTVEAFGELAAANRTVEIAAGTVEKGTVGAMRTTIEAKHRGRTVLRFRANWYVTTDIDADWSLRNSGWRLQSAGDTPVLVDIHFPVAEEDYAAFTPGLTAHRPVNAIPAVCEAPAGIRTTVDLPQIVPMFS